MNSSKKKQSARPLHRRFPDFAGLYPGRHAVGGLFCRHLFPLAALSVQRPCLAALLPERDAAAHTAAQAANRAVRLAAHRLRRCRRRRAALLPSGLLGSDHGKLHLLFLGVCHPAGRHTGPALPALRAALPGLCRHEPAEKPLQTPAEPRSRRRRRPSGRRRLLPGFGRLRRLRPVMHKTSGAPLLPMQPPPFANKRAGAFLFAADVAVFPLCGPAFFPII